EPVLSRPPREARGGGRDPGPVVREARRPRLPREGDGDSEGADGGALPGSAPPEVRGNDLDVDRPQLQLLRSLSLAPDDSPRIRRGGARPDLVRRLVPGRIRPRAVPGVSRIDGPRGAVGTEEDPCAVPPARRRERSRVRDREFLFRRAREPGVR